MAFAVGTDGELEVAQQLVRRTVHGPIVDLSGRRVNMHELSSRVKEME